MDTFQLVFDSSTIKTISRVDFDILGNEEIREMSSLAGTHGIDIPDLYDKSDPKRGGLIDPRMGGSGNTLCATCQLDAKYCDGHPAHIDLAEPVFHVGQIQYVKNILDCICIGCSNLLISKETDKVKQILQIKSHRNRMAKVHELTSKAKYCLRANQGCGIPVSKIKIEIKKSTSAINVYSETDIMDGDDKGNQEKKKHRLNLTPDQIADILDNIPPDDCKLLGMDPERSKPSDMIHKVFHVPPVHMRPSSRGDFTGGSTMEDGLTHKLADIIKANTRISKQKENNNENSSKYSKDHAHLLQYHIATYYDPDAISNPKSDQKGAQFKPLVARFKGKTGRVRGNLMGMSVRLY